MNIDDLMKQGLQSLEDVKAGDWLLLSTGSYSCRNSAKIVQVDRVTKTQIIIGPSRYQRDGGLEVGSSKWSYNRVQVATDGLILEIKVDAAKRVLRAMADDIAKSVGIMTNTSVVNAELLEQIESITASLREVRKALP